MIAVYSSIAISFDSHKVHVYFDVDEEIWWNAEDIHAIFPKCKELHVDGIPAAYQLLEMVVALSFIMPTDERAFRFLQLLSSVAQNNNRGNKLFWQLYKCVVVNFVRATQFSDTNGKPHKDEFDFHEDFAASLEQYIPGAKLVTVPHKQGFGIPDFFVQVERDICPVEIKRGRFTPSAVNQLRGYILGYSAPYGYAVAHKLSAPLDKNMIFIELEE